MSLHTHQNRTHGFPSSFSWSEFLCPCCCPPPSSTLENNSSSSENSSRYCWSSFQSGKNNNKNNNNNIIIPFTQKSSNDCGLACVATVASFFLLGNDRSNNTKSTSSSFTISRREQELFRDKIDSVFLRNFTSSSSSSTSNSMSTSMLLVTPMWTIEMFELLKILLLSPTTTSNDGNSVTRATSINFYTSLKDLDSIENQWIVHCENQPQFYGKLEKRNYHYHSTSEMTTKNDNNKNEDNDDDSDDKDERSHLYGDGDDSDEWSDKSRLRRAVSRLRRKNNTHQQTTNNDNVFTDTELATEVIVQRLLSSQSTTSESSSFFFYITLLHPLFLDCNCHKNDALHQLVQAATNIDDKIKKFSEKRIQSDVLSRTFVPFVGHFVVVVGVSECGNYLFLWDPASSSSSSANRPHDDDNDNTDRNDGDDANNDESLLSGKQFCVVSVKSFDKARKVISGSDMEVIEVVFS